MKRADCPRPCEAVCPADAVVFPDSAPPPAQRAAMVGELLRASAGYVSFACLHMRFPLPTGKSSPLAVHRERAEGRLVVTGGMLTSFQPSDDKPSPFFSMGLRKARSMVYIGRRANAETVSVGCLMFFLRWPCKNNTSGGVLGPRCYGCGRCITVCPPGIIRAEKYKRSPGVVRELLEKVDGVEIHTKVSDFFSFRHKGRVLPPCGRPSVGRRVIEKRRYFYMEI